MKVVVYDSVGSKFFPRVILSLMMFLSILLFLKRDDKTKGSNHKREGSHSIITIFTFTIVSFFYVLALRYYVGFVLSSFIYLVIIIFIMNESPLKTPSSKLPTFYFKIGQLVEFDHKKRKRKILRNFLSNLKQVFKKQTVTGLH